jgi:hypothetical protein
MPAGSHGEVKVWVWSNSCNRGSRDARKVRLLPRKATGNEGSQPKRGYLGCKR